MDPGRRRRWFRFSLRSLLAAMTLLACFLAWELRIVRSRQSALKEAAPAVVRDVVTAAEYQERSAPGMAAKPKATVPMIRRWMRDEAIQEIWYLPSSDPEDQARLDRLRALFPEAEFSQSQILFEPCHPGCFPRGTLVDVPGGARPIESIVPGDRVRAIRRSGEAWEAPVQSVFVADNRLWRVDTAAGELLTTQTQPLCRVEGSTVAAGDLRAGDVILRDSRGELQPVEVTHVEATDRVEKVFNLVLGDDSRFIAAGFVVRSKPPPTKAR